ncbi:hypothetical protein BJX66DRAFT_343744 [Aspergillus keveii]|uniref:Uncharacterized protein n=1 Tax=Aspergillus keveii TaxID=714993 RepID=A0ABR4FNE9_9EURO
MRTNPSNPHTHYHLTLHIGPLDPENWIVALDSPYRNQGLALAYVFTVDSGYRGHYIGTLTKTTNPETQTQKQTHTHTLTFPATTHDMPTLAAEVHEVCAIDPSDQTTLFHHAVLALRRREDWDAGFLCGLEWERIIPPGINEEYAERVYGIKEGVWDEDVEHASDMGGTGLGILESIESDWFDASPVDELVEEMQGVTMVDMWFDGTPKVDFSRRPA